MKKEIKEIRKIMEDFGIDNKVKIVKVCWKDAHTNHNTLSLGEVVKQKLLPAETIGYLLHEDDDVYVVCGFWFWDEETDILDERGCSAYREVHTIPKSQVHTIIVLKIDYEESKKFLSSQKGDRKWKLK